MPTSSLGIRIVLGCTLAAMLVPLAGCPTFEQAQIVIDVKAQTMTFTFRNLSSDALPWEVREDYMAVFDMARKLPTLPLKEIPGPDLLREYHEDEAPKVSYVSHQLMVRDNQLDGEVVVTFESLSDLGIYQHDKKSPFMWCGDGLVSTNGQLVKVPNKCAVWDRKADTLELTLAPEESTELWTSLLPTYQAHQKEGAPSDWPTSMPLPRTFIDQCEASDLHGPLAKLAGKPLQQDVDGDDRADTLTLGEDGVLRLELSATGTHELSPEPDSTPLLQRYAIPRRMPAAVQAVAKRALAPSTCTKPDSSLAALRRPGPPQWVDGAWEPPSTYLTTLDGDWVVYHGSRHMRVRLDSVNLVRREGNARIYSSPHGVFVDEGSRHAWLYVSPHRTRLEVDVSVDKARDLVVRRREANQCPVEETRLSLDEPGG